MPTRAGWGVAILGLASIIAGRTFAWLELFAIGMGLLALVGVATLDVRLRRPVFALGRDVSPSRVHAGDNARVDLVVENRGTRRSPTVTLQDPVAGTSGANVRLAPLRAGERRGTAYRLPTTRRGILRIGPLTVSRTDPLGLARTAATSVDVRTVTVYPHIDVVDPPGAGRRDPMAGLAIERHRTDRRDEFARLRAYVPGDDLRMVHWRSSARTGDLVVRQDEEPLPLRVAVILDTRRAAHPTSASFERAVSAAASLLSAAHRAGQRALLVTTDGTEVEVEPGGDRHLAAFELLTTVEPTASASLRGTAHDLRPVLGGGTLVLVTGRATAQELRAVLGARWPRPPVVVVCEGPLPAGALGPVAHLVDATAEGAFAASWSATRAGARRGGVA
jgi:uncharacterized protein (DUF58 family)